MGFFVCMKREGDEKGTAEPPSLHTGFYFEFHSFKEETLFIATPQSHFVRQLPGRGAFWHCTSPLLSRPWQQLSRPFAKVAQHKHERSCYEQPQRGKAC